MSVARRPPRSHHKVLRRPRLEGLEGRALLSTTTPGAGDWWFPTASAGPSASAPPVVAPLSEAVGADGPSDGGDWWSEPLLDEGARGTSELIGIATNYPWRIACWRLADEPRLVISPLSPAPGESPTSPASERPRVDLETARILPSRPSLRLEGAVQEGMGLDLYGIPISRSTRSLEISYFRLDAEGWGDPAENAPFRVWMSDAEGNVIATWWVDPEALGLSLQVHALAPPEPTTLYVGIEAAGAGGGGAAPVPYALEVVRGGGPGSATSPIAIPGPGGSPPLGGESSGSGGSGGPGVPILLPLIASGAGLGVAPVDASGGFGFGPVGVGGPGPVGLDPTFARPLPIQSAASAGGLLPAGPDVRGDSGAPDRVPEVDEFADPLLAAVEQVDPPGLPASAGDDAIGPERPEADPSGTSLVADAGAVGLGGSTASWGPVTLAGPSGPRIRLAGLRIGWGRPAVPPALGVVPASPEDLAAIAAVHPPAADGGGGGELAPVPPRIDDGIAPTRPRVLRTALIGAAALTVGLLLPDLAADGPSLRPRVPTPMRPWRSPRPRTA